MFGFNDHIIYICFNCLVDLFLKACLDHALISGAGVFESERHSVEAERSVRSNECHCVLIGFFLINLMVSGVCVEET